MPRYYNIEKLKKLLSKKADGFSQNSVQSYHLRSFAFNLPLHNKLDQQNNKALHRCQ
jgi:hypothetical protein